MTGPTTKPLNGKQAKALAALLCTPTLAAAAKTGQVSQRTLFRFLREPHFVAAYEAARRAQVEHALMNLQRIAFLATQTLEKVMGDVWCKPSARVAASKAVLSFVLRESDDDQTLNAPPAEPAFDFTKLTPTEWATFKTLYLKVRPYRMLVLPATEYHPTKGGAL